MFPDLPTIAEAGVPGLRRADLERHRRAGQDAARDRDAAQRGDQRALASPAFIERFGKIGDEPAGGLPEEFGETIRVELAKWADVVKRSGAKLE